MEYSLRVIVCLPKIQNVKNEELKHHERRITSELGNVGGFNWNRGV